jgi:hypothetical protein
MYMLSSGVTTCLSTGKCCYQWHFPIYCVFNCCEHCLPDTRARSTGQKVLALRLGVCID